MAAILTQGAKIFWSSDNDGTVSDWAQVTGVTAITIPSGQNEEVESTTIDRARTAGRAYIRGFREDASVNVTIQFDGKEASHQNLLTVQAAQTETAFLIETPQSSGGVTTIQINKGKVRNLSINEAVNAIQSATFDILMRAAPTIAHSTSAQS